MLWNDVANNWAAYLPRILTKWPALDEDELLALDGDQHAFLDYLAAKNGNDEVMAQMQLADWLMGEEPSDVMMDTTRDNARISASAQNIPAGEVASDSNGKFGAENVDATPLGKTA